MIGLDTNVLVRYFAQDDATQSRIATDIVEGLTEQAQGFVSLTALVELAWVLARCYHVRKIELVRILESLFKSREILVENTPLVYQALRLFAQCDAGFSDCLIERAGSVAGCDFTYTFDHAAVAALAGMKAADQST